MASVNTIQTLNQLATLLNRSLPLYLSDAKPYLAANQEGAASVLAAIANEQREMVNRIGRFVTDEDGVAELGSFPLSYTALHDLSFDYLCDMMIQQQEKNIAKIEALSSLLSLSPHAKALAEESLGAAKGHLDSLRELTQAGAAPG